MIPASYAPRDPPPDSTNPTLGRVDGDCTSIIVPSGAALAQPFAETRCPGHMRHLGLIMGVLGVTAGTAGAGRTLFEYGAALPMRQAEQLVETACDLSIELRGAIADIEVRQKLKNPGPAELGAVAELDVKPSMQLIGMTIQKGRGKPEAGIQVSAPIKSERVTSPQALGADPAIVMALPTMGDSQRYRFIVQPLAAEQEVTLAARWTTVAEIRDGALHLGIPGHGGGGILCHGLVHAVPGPGATVERIRLNNAEISVRGTATFDVGADDVTLSAVLAFKRAQPLVWTQTQTLGDGHLAHAVTVATPAIKSTTARRALLVIDSSRSMELVGRHNIQKLVRAIGTALPPKSELEAVLFDRTQQRILGAWKPATPESITAIETAVGNYTAGNGSDTAAALAFARKLIDDTRGQTMVILLTDGVLGDLAPDALKTALAASPADLDLHAITLAPGRMETPDSIALRAVINHVGGSYVQVATRELDTALASIDDWLRPAWQQLALRNFEPGIPDQVRAGTGFVAFDIVKRAAKLELTGQAAKPIKISATKAPAAPLAQLALAPPGTDDEALRAKLRERHPAVNESHALVVLATSGTVAASRRTMIAGGGPYTRMVEVEDPRFAFSPPAMPAITLGGSVVDRSTITFLLRQYLQPAAFVCYQKALATNGALSGTALFKLEIGRGELTRAEVSGVGDATFDACLLEAAYKVTPPLPNPDINIDDRTVVNYPLTFTVREHKPFILAGDADSSAPLDIDAIKGGPPTAKRGRVQTGDTRTPLGNLRPAPTP